MRKSIAVVVLSLYGSTAFGDEPDLVEAARRAMAYWNSRFSHCTGERGNGWYATSINVPGAIQMARELKIQFKTEEISQVERLNGTEFKATSSLEPGVFRWWIPETRTWRDWQVGDIAPPLVLLKKKGVWFVKADPGRSDDGKAYASCSEIPPMN